MSKILVVGNADSIYVKSVIEKTMIDFHDDIAILSPKNTLYSDYYAKHGVIVYSEKGVRGKVGTLMCGILNYRFFRRGYDTICFHFMSKRSYVMLPTARFCSKNIITSFWGSDVLRVNRRNILCKLLLNLPDKITLITDSMEVKFHQLYGNKYDSKIFKVDFGSDIIQELNELTENEEQIRKKYSIDSDKVVISIGYNKSPAQQHLDVLNKIGQLPQKIKERIHIILRLTYGSGDEQYVKSVRDKVKETGCRSSLFETYMDNREIAEITKITDVFIHAQTTDAQSATVCEHLYAKCLVLNPRWIRYKELEDKVFYLQYSDFDQLSGLLSENIKRKKDSAYADQLNANAQTIYNICSWQSMIPKWRELYSDNIGNA